MWSRWGLGWLGGDGAGVAGRLERFISFLESRRQRGRSFTPTNSIRGTRQTGRPAKTECTAPAKLVEGSTVRGHPRYVLASGWIQQSPSFTTQRTGSLGQPKHCTKAHPHGTDVLEEPEDNE